MNEHLQDILAGGRPMTKLEKAKKEIEKLTVESTKWESKFYDETKKVDKAIEYIKPFENLLINEFSWVALSYQQYYKLLDTLRGEDNE